ncbi:cytochrome P450 [Streptomyces sp. NPDC047515]|uniref:cytochrome P450 n=1 Tax=Streptomyces sp. NPDC047515 TaxID=3155380 RepID=UPI0033C9B6B8
MPQNTAQSSAEEAQPSFKPYEGKADSPWEELARDRARCPVAHSKFLESIQVTEYEAVKEVNRNHGAFSSTYSAAWPLEEPVPEEMQVFILSDPPRHTRQRRLVVKALSASRVARMRPFTERVVNDLIDAIAGQGGAFDLGAEFAVPMSEAHITELLGIPEDDRAYFLRMSHRFQESTATINREGIASAAMEEWRRHLLDEVRSRREAGPENDDLITQLCFAEEEDGDRFDGNEIALIIMGLIAGTSSTASAVVNIACTLEQHREQKTKYTGDIDGLTSSLVEEGLRYDGPIFGLYRMTLKEAEIGHGVTARPGDRIYFSLGAANHDPEVYDRPDEFIIDRDWKNLPSHLAFGYGVHHCLGMNLGRLQAEVALATLYRRLPGLRIRPGFQPVQVPGPIMRAWGALEMTYDGPVRPRTDAA